MDKNNEKQVYRGDLYYADLDPVRGSEQGGTRPVVVVQNDRGNRYSPTLIVAATTGQKKPDMPTHVHLKVGENGNLNKETTVLLEQIRTIDRSRLGSYIGSINDESLEGLDKALAISVGLPIHGNRRRDV